MDKKKIIYFLIIIGALILAASFLLFFKGFSGQDQEIVSPDTPGTASVNNFIKNVETVSENTSKIADSGKFNEVINKAQAAFANSDYSKSVQEYKNALAYGDSDSVYAGLFITYTATQEWGLAMESVDKAIMLNPLNVDYWKWKLSLADERTDIQYSGLNQIYETGLKKVRAQSAVNLTTHFAVISENNGRIAEALILWENAKVLNPDGSALYQKEIDRLNSN